uniref:C-type lectin domain-containing protein n=1 Tax=Xiphophorus couchianus TaxID=32473 RepID=A0A3B5M315_9TELE
SLHVLPVHAWVLSGFSSFLPQSKNMTVRLIGLTKGVCVGGCEAGWERYGGSCYFFSNSTSSWNDSRRSCADLGSDLVKIDSREELRETIKNNETFWIGLTYSKTEGSWLWPDRSPLNTRSDYSEIIWFHFKKVRWYDRRCDDDLRSICEKDSKIQLRFCV